MAPRWYEHALFYSLSVPEFRDSDGDGCGDLRGVLERLDHLEWLGVTGLWLQPMYVSSRRDHGYDVVDHLAVDPRLGTEQDLRDVVAAARERGIRVVLDLVANHTSDAHPWFREARADRDSPRRAYYVWSDEPRDVGVEPIFPGVEQGVWTWDEQAEQHYLHRFYAFEPDLANGEPAVQREIERIVRYWMDAGVSGFRVDAAPYVVEKIGWTGGDGQAFLRRLRELVDSYDREAVLLAETDVEPAEYEAFFGAGSGVPLLFNFFLNNYVFLGLARRHAEPVERALRTLAPPPPGCHYLTWLRNHDELDLERLSAEERGEVFGAFAPQPEMRVYGRGVRRRLAPMLGGDPRRLGLAFALLFGLPGVPTILYGDEIGMGDDLDRPERESVRPPMQWSDAPAAGFSTAPADRLVAPVVDAGPFAYHRLNVDEQRGRPDSLLHTVRRLAGARVASAEIATGRFEIVGSDRPSVLALRYDAPGSSLLTLANLSGSPVGVRLDGLSPQGWDEVVADSAYDRPPGDVTDLAGYGWRWLRRRRTG